MLLGGLCVGDEFLHRMNRHHALGRQRRLGLKIFVVRIEAHRHHVGPKLHELDFFFDARRRHAELHDRINLVHDGVLQALPVVLVDARDLPAVRLDRLLEGATAVDVRDRRAGIHGIDILLRNTVDVLLRRAQMVVRIGRARVAGNGDDQLFHRHSLAVSYHPTLTIWFERAACTMASNTDMPCNTSSIGTG